MQIHELPALGRNPTTGDKLALDTGSATYSIDYSALAATIMNTATDFSSNVTFSIAAAYRKFVRQGNLCMISYQSALLSTLDDPPANGDTIFTLPSAHLPSAQQFGILTVNSIGYGSIIIPTSGICTINSITSGLTSGRIVINCVYVAA